MVVVVNNKSNSLSVLIVIVIIVIDFLLLSEATRGVKLRQCVLCVFVYHNNYNYYLICLQRFSSSEILPKLEL